jgi:hypothetical protein
MITIPNINTANIHGVVLISEMYPFLDWQNIAETIKDNSDPQENIMLHIIELPDFERLSLVAQSSILFSKFMTDRFLVMLSHKTAFISGKISPYE